MDCYSLRVYDEDLITFRQSSENTFSLFFLLSLGNTLLHRLDKGFCLSRHDSNYVAFRFLCNLPCSLNDDEVFEQLLRGKGGFHQIMLPPFIRTCIFYL